MINRAERQLSAVVFAPLSVECFAIRALGRTAGIRVVQSGMGKARSRRAASQALHDGVDAVAVLGFCGALSRGLQPGEVVVADAVRTSDGSVPCAGAKWITTELERAGVKVARGVVRSTDHIVRGAERTLLEMEGAIAVDMESAWLAPKDSTPFAVVRTVVDTPERELSRPWKTVSGGIRAYGSLRTTARVVRDWLEHQASLTRSSDNTGVE